MKRLMTTVLAALSATMLGCQSGPPREWSTRPGAAAEPRSGSSMGTLANLRSTAIGVLEEAASSDSPLLQANAIEGLHGAPDHLDAYVRQGLIDENRGVRFVSAMTIGELELRDIAHLVEPLLNDSSESVRAAAIYALRRCGHKVNLNPLAEMLRSGDPEIRGNVAMILGRLGEPSAIPMIEQAYGRRLDLAGPAHTRIVELQLAEAMVRLGKAEQVDPIRAALFVPGEEMEVSALAASILGRLNDRGSVGGLWRLVNADGSMRRPAEVRLAAVAALAMIGEPVSPDLVRDYMSSDLPAVRHQTAATLGAIGTPSVLGDLQTLLDDPNPLVQVGAASAILRLES